MRALQFITGHVIYNPAYMYLQIPTENHLVHIYAFSDKSDSVRGLNGAQWLRISLAFNDNINSSKQRTEENPERMV